MPVFSPNSREIVEYCERAWRRPAILRAIYCEMQGKMGQLRCGLLFLEKVDNCQTKIDAPGGVT